MLIMKLLAQQILGREITPEEIAMTGFEDISAPSLLKLAAALDANPQWIIVGEGDPFQMQAITKESEQELMQAFREMDPKAQAALIAAAHAMKR